MSPSSFFSLFIQLQIHLLVIHPAVSLHMPQFTWTGPLSLHAQLDPSTEDTIILQHANTVPGVVVTCLFQGIFQREINGSAVISGCRASPVVHVTIISRYLRGRTMFQIRDNLTQEVVSAYSGNENLENEDEVSRFRRSLFPGDEMAQYDYLDYSDPLPTDLVLKMKFAYDESFKRHLGSDAAARKYIAEVVTHGKEYFKEESLGTNIFLDIQGPPQLLPNKELDISGPSFVEAQEVKAEEPIPLSVFCYTDDEDSLMGVSKRGKACDANLGISLTKWRCNVLKAAQTFAHESGHMDGFFHDAWEDAVNEANGITSNCEGTGLMSDDTPFEDRPNAWSICTSQRFAKWFRRFGKECIAEVIPCNEGSGSWRTPCKCGSGPAPSLCVAGHTCCQHQTATCLGEPSDIVKLYAIIQSMKLEMESLRRDIGENRAGITTNSAGLATKCDINTCSDIQTKATKLESCLADASSADCPPSASDKIGIIDAIQIKEWTIIQRRGQLGNSEDYFYKDFSDYENGFGSVDAELWLGLKNIGALTSVGEWELQVDLTDWDDAKYHALYTGFSVGPSPTYRLNFVQFQDAKSTLGDSLGYSKGHAFSTRDRDQDNHSSNCAQSYKGGWWFKACHNSNLNGLNYAQQKVDGKGVSWYYGKTRGNVWKSWKASVIKIRRVDV